jgi:hypothetical protein
MLAKSVSDPLPRTAQLVYGREMSCLEIIWKFDHRTDKANKAKKSGQVQTTVAFAHSQLTNKSYNHF